MRSILIILICGFLTGFVSACQTDVYQRGKGPLIVSSRIMTGFEKYKLENDPLFLPLLTTARGLDSRNVLILVVWMTLVTQLGFYVIGRLRIEGQSVQFLPLGEK
jgi:hypothetical protein